MQFKLRSVVACVVLGSAGYLASCSSGSGDGDGDSGGKGGSASGGKGGSTSGGKGGSTSGGKGGSASGGSGGVASGGSGGSAAGGSAGGMGGSPPAGGAGGMPPAPSGDAAFFSGKEMAVKKLVAGDAMPGYFYNSENAVGPTFVEVSDPMLPEGTKYAVTFHLADPTKGGNFIVGWNWRQNTADKKWSPFDAKAYAGFSFWTKLESPERAVGFNIIGYDSSNFPNASMMGGSCTNASTDIDPCPPVTDLSTVTSTKLAGWEKKIVRFDYAPTGMVKLESFLRVDLLKSRISAGGGDHKLFLTGVQFLKEAEIPAP